MTHPLRPLGDISDVSIGRQRSPKHTTGPDPLPYIRAANVKDGRLDLSSVLYMDFSSDEQNRYGLERGDVLVTEGCGSPAELGASATWRGELQGFVGFQNHVLRLRPRGGLSDERFLGPLARWCHHSGKWREVASGTSILNIGLGRARGILVPAPPVRTQAQIGAIFEALESLILNLQRRIELLEQMAEAIYREWFVHFRYPGHDDDTLVDSPLGSIPEGWAITRTGDLIQAGQLDIGDGYRAKNSEMLGSGLGLPFVRIANVHNGHLRLSECDQLPSSYRKRLGPKISQAGDSLISTKGTVGRCAYVDDRYPAVAYSPQVSYWRSVDPLALSPFYIHFWLRSEQFTEQCAAVKGATDMADYVNLRDQRQMILLRPSKQVMARFGELAADMLSAVGTLRRAAERLAQLRDLLLPKLVTGQIDVSGLGLDAAVDSLA